MLASLSSRRMNCWAPNPVKGAESLPRVAPQSPSQSLNIPLNISMCSSPPQRLPIRRCKGNYLEVLIHDVIIAL